MKIYKLLFLTFLSCFALSCSQDTFEDKSIDNPNDRLVESQFDNSYLGVYKGLFSTNDGLTRGTVVVTLSPTNEAVAQIKLSTGLMIELKSSTVKLTVDNTVENLRFSSAGLSNIDATLNFSVEGNGLNPIISNVTFDNQDSDILIAKNLSRAPLTTVTGTYMRTAGTGGFPTSGRTWNVMAVGFGDQTYSTQIWYGGHLYNRTDSSTQSNCASTGDFTTCDIAGSADILGYDVTWTGTHTFDRYSDNTACSEVSGTWSALAYAGSSGTFVSDTDCSDVQLSNDFCEDADVIALEETITGFTEGFGFVATAGDTPVGNCDDNLAGSADGIGVWYTFTSPIDGEIVVDLSGSDFDTQLRVFSGTCGALVCVGNDDDSGIGGDGFQSLLSYTATANETYLIFIGGWNTSTGNYTLNVREVPPAPDNDLCGDAISLTCGGSDSGTTNGSTNTGSPTGCSDNLFNGDAGAGTLGVWYSVSTTTDQQVTVDLSGSDFDTQLRVFSGTCGALVCVANDDDGGTGGTGLQSKVSFIAEANETYLVFIAGYLDAVGNYAINVSCEDVPEPSVYSLTPGCDTTFVDNGEDGNYLSSTSDTYLIDAGAGNIVSLPFTTFNIEEGWDFLRIYDGQSTSDPEITEVNGRVIVDYGDPDIGFTGTGTGANSLEGQTVVSSGRYLTIVFNSDTTGEEAGFLAIVGCELARTGVTNNIRTSETYRPSVSTHRAAKVSERLTDAQIAKRRISANRNAKKAKN